ncbi:HNH endonuclease [Geodermatophilus tzadiensis]|uniref:HNH endonuclease n=1 Tax=Geodermatophilus tzadiensis TaxID=1137988 RepID=A0A2T0TVN1_9ACTN|nr:HNH endonuclease signature motif containing protein [Geodermatophilus tzadiensis]PRY49713.1 HNH endonuclease [Geodermatophilus tzadiensis]
MCSDASLTGDALEDVAALVAERNRIDALLARRVRAAELSGAPERDGAKSMRSWLPGHCRLSAAAAARIVGNGRVLEHMPALAEAHDAGLVGAEQVAVAATALTPERLQTAAEHGVDLAEIDAVLTGAAIEQRYADFVAVVRHYLAQLDPDGPEPDPTEGRRLTLTKHADGSLSVRGELDAVGGEKLQAALESFVQADRPAGDERSRAQRLGDALVQLCDTALAAGGLPTLRTVKPHVAVVIDLADLADPATGPEAGRMGFGATISAARARWLACDATVSRVVFGPDGAPIDLGREQRVADRYLRRAVELRDGGCVFAGCAAPTWWAEVHHLVHWLDGGETTLTNSALLCERHHTKVHHGFRVERQPDGRWRTWRPDGTEITVPTPLAPAAA